jgi:hypothetical protein
MHPAAQRERACDQSDQGKESSGTDVRGIESDDLCV